MIEATIIALLLLIAVAVGGLKALLAVAFIVIFIGACIVGWGLSGINNLADKGDELNERDKREQSKG